MQKRKEILDVLIERIKQNRSTLHVKTLKHNPTSPFISTDLPGVFLYEGVDNILKYSSGTPLGYPVFRECEITLEIITDSRYDLLTMYRGVRSVVLNSDLPSLQKGSLLREKFSEGPTGYGVPDVLGMRLVMSLTYSDDGL